jgi:hypothetical protein
VAYVLYENIRKLEFLVLKKCYKLKTIRISGGRRPFLQEIPPESSYLKNWKYLKNEEMPLKCRASEFISSKSNNEGIAYKGSLYRAVLQPFYRIIKSIHFRSS